MTEEDIAARLDQLESLVEQQNERIDQQEATIEEHQETIQDQQETIKDQRERIAELEADDQSDQPGNSDESATRDSDQSATQDSSLTPMLNRRSALKVGGLFALLAGGTATASADPQGQIGTSSDPLQAVYTEELYGNSGTVTVRDDLDLNGNLDMGAGNAVELNTDDLGGNFSRPGPGHLLFGMASSDAALLFGEAGSGGENDGQFVIRTQDDGDEEILLQQHNSTENALPVTQLRIDEGGNVRINNDLLTQGGTTLWDGTSIPQGRLQNDSVIVAGNSVSLGGSTSVNHADISGVGPDDHHSRDHDHSEAGISAVPNGGLTNSSVTVAGNSVSLGGSTGIAHSDLSGIGSGDHHTRPSAGDGLTENSNTFDINPSDFAGSLLSEDGSNNLQVDEGAISHDTIDQTTVNSSDHHTRPSAGDGLKENSNSFDIEPADFAGNALEDDGSDNLAVSSGGIGTNELSTPFGSLSDLFGSPVTAGGDIKFADNNNAIVGDSLSIKTNVTGITISKDGAGAFTIQDGDENSLFELFKSGGLKVPNIDNNDNNNYSGTNLIITDSGLIVKDTSSIRYKTNIEALSATERVLDLVPRSFEYKGSGQQGVGLIAEEVEEVLPEVVTYDQEGRPESVRYNRLGVFLVPEVEANRDRIDALEADGDDRDERIADLEAENEQLRERNAALESRLDRLESAVGIDGPDAAGVADD